MCTSSWNGCEHIIRYTFCRMVNRTINIEKVSTDELIDQYVPIKVLSRRNVPWFTPALNWLVHTKLRKYNKYDNNPNNRYLTEYNKYCKFVRSKITSCKINFEKRKIMRKNTNLKPFFNYINSRKNALSLLQMCSITTEPLLMTQKKQIFLSNSIVLCLQKLMVFFLNALNV